MLVLTRKEGESITITDDRGEVTVIKIIWFERKGMASRVAVGIESPRKFKVMRTEIIPQQPTPPPSYGQKVDER